MGWRLPGHRISVDPTGHPTYEDKKTVALFLSFCWLNVEDLMRYEQGPWPTGAYSHIAKHLGHLVTKLDFIL